jgi:hypothetical protein
MLKEDLKEDLLELADANIKPIFVFPGLDHINKSPLDSQSVETARAAELGWARYKNNRSDDAVKEFSKAKYPIGQLFRYLQEQLIENDIEFLVAPFSAVAQLSYMLKLDTIIDAIFGSTEHFLFGIDKVITNLNIPFDKSTQVTFTFISKSSCEERLKVPPDVLRDAQLLCGTSFSLPFPILERQSTAKAVSISDAIALLNTSQRSVLSLCNLYRDDPDVSRLDYATRYKKTLMTIRHHVILEMDGKVSPLDFPNAPGDVHDFVGQNLPEELFFYISRGLIGPEVPTWLTSGEINLQLPGSVPDNDVYRNLVIDQLHPIRIQALRMLSEPLNYYYKGRIIKTTSWIDRSPPIINLKEEPDLRPRLQWKVTSVVPSSPTLLSCLKALSDKEFVSKSLSKHPQPHPALKTKEEVLANVFWRFLQVRGYVDESHKLTRWGEVLEAVLGKMKDAKHHSGGEDAALLAVELMRLGLLNGNEVDGIPVPASGKCLLFPLLSYHSLLSLILS